MRSEEHFEENKIILTQLFFNGYWTQPLHVPLRVQGADDSVAALSSTRSLRAPAFSEARDGKSDEQLEEQATEVLCLKKNKNKYFRVLILKYFPCPF